MPDADFGDRRIFERIPVNLPVRLLDLESNKENTGNANDISAKGIGLSLNKRLLPLTPLEMWLDIPDHGESLYTRGEVVWSKMVNNECRIGVKLERADLMAIARVLRANNVPENN